jgi:hypothetical protein
MNILFTKFFSLRLRPSGFSFRCAIFLFLFQFSAVAQNPAGINWHYHSTSSFVIAYREADRTLAIRVLGELQERQRQLAQRLGFQPRRVITAFLCPTQYIFDHMTGGGVPHWGEAAANTAQWRIYLKTPTASDMRELLPSTVTHELAHLCLAELAQPNILPRWFNEGAAIFLSNEARPADPTIISRALLTNSLVDFEEIDDLLSFQNARAALAYAESYQAVSFITQRFGKDAIGQFARALAVQSDSRQAFRIAFGEDLWDFEAEFFDYLRRHFRWYFLLDDSFLFGGIILLLLVAGFFVTRWRTKKKMQEWEKEESDGEEESLPPQITA